MAEEKADAAEGAGDGAGKKGGSKLPLLAGIAVAVLVLGGGGAWWLGLFGHRGGDTAEAKEKAEGAEAAAEAAKPTDVGALAPLDPFIANLSDEDGRRYLKATLALEFTKSSVPAEFNARLPQIRDLLLTLLSSKTFAEVRTPQGKAVLRDEIVSRVNHAMREDVVKAVYFTEFIVQ
jgi:flagellar FliL protein